MSWDSILDKDLNLIYRRMYGQPERSMPPTGRGCGGIMKKYNNFTFLYPVNCNWKYCDDYMWVDVNSTSIHLYPLGVLFCNMPFNIILQYAFQYHFGRVKRIWYLSPMRAAKVQASLRIRAVSPEPPLLAHTSSESRGTFRQKARSLAPLNGCACAVKICHDGMLQDTNSLDASHLLISRNSW